MNAQRMHSIVDALRVALATSGEDPDPQLLQGTLERCGECGKRPSIRLGNRTGRWMAFCGCAGALHGDTPHEVAARWAAEKGGTSNIEHPTSNIEAGRGDLISTGRDGQPDEGRTAPEHTPLRSPCGETGGGGGDVGENVEHPTSNSEHRTKGVTCG